MAFRASSFCKDVCSSAESGNHNTTSWETSHIHAPSHYCGLLCILTHSQLFQGGANVRDSRCRRRFVEVNILKWEDFNRRDTMAAFQPLVAGVTCVATVVVGSEVEGHEVWMASHEAACGATELAFTAADAAGGKSVIAQCLNLRTSQCSWIISSPISHTSILPTSNLSRLKMVGSCC